MLRCTRSTCTVALAGLICLGIVTTAPAQSGRLAFTESVGRDSLKTVVSVSLSPDGKFAYAAGYQARAITAFRRDAKTGGLTLLQTFEDKELLNGVTALRLSPDGKLGIATSFLSNTAALFSRDPKTGRLKLFDVVSEGKRGATGLEWVIDAVFSPDGKFIYAIADRSAAVVTLKVVDGKLLEFVASDKGRDACFAGARGIAASPDGKSLYVTSDRSGTLTVLARDPKTGKTAVKQVLKDGVAGVAGLTGAFGVTCSHDGRFVYTASGRFRGKTALCAFKRSADGAVELVQTLSDLEDFAGGNEILVGSAGKRVYVCGTTSSSIEILNCDRKTGKLTHAQTLKNNTDGKLGSVAGLAISPDGRFLYAAAETNNAISIYKRQGPSKD
jgi:6-phosphogluconolactonase (cycloisomerase 2 family)